MSSALQKWFVGACAVLLLAGCSGASEDARPGSSALESERLGDCLSSVLAFDQDGTGNDGFFDDFKETVSPEFSTAYVVQVPSALRATWRYSDLLTKDARTPLSADESSHTDAYVNATLDLYTQYGFDGGLFVEFGGLNSETDLLRARAVRAARNLFDAMTQVPETTTPGERGGKGPGPLETRKRVSKHGGFECTRTTWQDGTWEVECNVFKVYRTWVTPYGGAHLCAAP
jgi:hypothetical protein